MADRQTGSVQPQRPARPSSATTTTTVPGGAFLRNAPNSTQFIGYLTLLISGGILLLLSGLTITVSVLGLIFFTPLIIISSPIWVPAVTVLFMAVAGFLSIFGFGVAAVAGLSWIYRYFRGLHPPGSDRVDYARSRISDTAREYGGFVHSKAKDAAPGA